MAKKRKGEMSGEEIFAQIQKEGGGNLSVQAQIQAELKAQKELEEKLLAEQKKSTKAVEELVDITKEELNFQKQVSQNRTGGTSAATPSAKGDDSTTSLKGAFKEAAMSLGNKAFNTAFPQFGAMLDKKFEEQKTEKGEEPLATAVEENTQATGQVAEQVGTSNQILTTLVSRQEQTNLILEKVLKAIESGGTGGGGGGGIGASIADALGSVGGGGGKGAGAGAGGAASGSKPGFLSKAGGFIKGAAKGVGGLLGGMALDYASDKLTASGHEKLGAAASIGSSALTGAGYGAMLGPAGAAVGGALGGAYGLYKNWGNLTGGPSKSADVAQSQAQAIMAPPVSAAKPGGPIISPSQSAGGGAAPAPSAAIIGAQSAAPVSPAAAPAGPAAASLGGPSPAAAKVASQGAGGAGGTTGGGSTEDLKTGENGKLDPSTLTSIGSGHRLAGPAAAAYTTMASAAKEEGVSWGITDSYRDFNTQVRLAKEKGLYSQGGLAATPGRSNHGWGLATDLNIKDPKAQAWLQANAGKYGFSTIPREPWHWEFKGGGASGGSAMAQAKPNPIKTAEASGEGAAGAGKKPGTEGSKGADAGKFPALVGEKGSETVISKDGSKKDTGQGPKVAMLTPGDQVIPAFASGTTNAQPITADDFANSSYENDRGGPRRYLAMPGGSTRVKRYASNDAFARAEGFDTSPITQEKLNRIDAEKERIKSSSFGSAERNAIMSSDQNDILGRRGLAGEKYQLTGNIDDKLESQMPDFAYNAQKRGQGWAAADAERAQAARRSNAGAGLKSLSEIDERNKRTSGQAITVNQNVESKPGSGGSNDSTSQVSNVEPMDAKNRFKDLFHMGHQ